MDESCLPVEILELIFYFCVPWLSIGGSPGSACAYSSSRRPPYPLAFTEVCKRWTWVARTSPRLWSVIDLSNAALAQHSINYTSGDLAPLRIVSGAAAAKITLSHIEETCTWLNRSRARLSISTIDVSLYPIVLSSLFRTLAGPLHSDFSLLTKLVLRVPPMTMFNPTAINVNVNVTTTIHDASSGPITLSISSLPIPNVRHLELDGVPVCWASVQSLEHLSLRGLVPDELASPTVLDLQGILARSKETLSFCRLENILFPIDDCDFAMEVEPILLQDLRTLSISAAPHVTSSILHSIKVPRSTHVQLYTLLRSDLRSILPPWFQIGDTSVRGDVDVTSLRLCRHSAAFLRPSAQAPRSSKRAVRNRYYPDSSSDWDSGDAMFSVSSASSVPVPMAILDSVSYASSSLDLRGSKGVLGGRGIYDLKNLASLTLGVGVLIDIPTDSLHTFLAYGAVNLEGLRVGYQCDLSVLLGALVVPSGRTSSGSNQETAMVVEESVLLPCPRLKLLAFNRPSDRWWNFGSMWLDSVVDTVVRRGKASPGQLRVEFWKCHGVTDVKVCESFERFGATIGEIGEVEVIE